MTAAKSETRPAATPDTAWHVSPAIRRMVPKWIADMVEDRPGDALAIIAALSLGEALPSEPRVALGATSRVVAP